MKIEKRKKKGGLGIHPSQSTKQKTRKINQSPGLEFSTLDNSDARFFKFRTSFCSGREGVSFTCAHINSKSISLAVNFYHLI